MALGDAAHAVNGGAASRIIGGAAAQRQRERANIASVRWRALASAHIGSSVAYAWRSMHRPQRGNAGTSAFWRRLSTAAAAAARQAAVGIRRHAKHRQRYGYRNGSGVSSGGSS
jgi:hypothetical protein